MYRPVCSAVCLATLAGTLASTGSALAQERTEARQEKRVAPVLPDAEALPPFERRDDRVLVRLRDPADFDRFVSGLAGGVSIGHRYDLVPGLLRLDVAPGTADAVLSGLHTNALLAYAEPDFIVREHNLPNDPQLDLLYGLRNFGQTIDGQSGFVGADVGVDAMWPEFIGDQDFVIAVIDSGMDLDHPDLVANLWTNPGEIAGNGVDDDNNGYVDDVHGWDFRYDDNDPSNGSSHGTHVSGTIAARGDNGVGVVGVVWQASIMPLKFLDGGGATSDGIAALEYAVEQGALISNNSWGGGGRSQSLEDALTASGDAGHLFVSSAGNGGSSTPSYPARYPNENVLAVAALDNRDRLAGFSDYNATSVDLGAPGVDTYSTEIGGGYSYKSGTSMASPHAAGVSAAIYMWGVDRGWTWRDVKEHVMNTSRPLASLDGRTVTGGAIDLRRAWPERVRPPIITAEAGLPAVVEPNTSAEVRVAVSPREQGIEPGSVVLHLRYAPGEPFREFVMTTADGEVFAARTLPLRCGDEPAWFVTATSGTGVEVSLASEAEPERFGVGVESVLLSETFDGDADGWTFGLPTDDATTGNWEAGDPQGTSAQPATGSDDLLCAATGLANFGSLGGNDIDDGRTTLVTPAFDLSGSNSARLDYQRWYSNTTGAAPAADVFEVEVSTDGVTWTLIDLAGPTSENSGGWVSVSRAFDTSTLGDAVQVRFVASDLGSGSLVEAAIDEVRVIATQCVACPADIDGDGQTTARDVLEFIQRFRAGGAAADYTRDGQTNSSDLLAYIDAFRSGC